ncbi:serpin family protein [Bacillus cabrialesii]|uniref:serpin family protein n=1 Tax=Bacillus cabrialesii TaxID=2487276 RepID=UPI001C055359|nr:serpin family protein [Bacillus cabrialesii]MBU2660934.1 serpin family protein [Bacillus cabrialesii]
MKGKMFTTLMLMFMLAGGGCKPTEESAVSVQSPAPPDSAKNKVYDIHEDFIEAERKFGTELFQNMSDKDGLTDNLLISPYSLQQVLLMTANGADRDTLKEIKAALYLSDIHDRAINESSSALMKRFESLSEGDLRTTNAIWSKLEAKPDFKQTIKQFFLGSVFKMDDNIQAAKNSINQWTAHQTKGHIDDIAGDLSPEAVSLLVNAVCFQEKWAMPFDRHVTAEEPFFLPDGSAKKLLMMKQTARLDYLENELFRAVKLPYEDKHLSFTLFLPKKKPDSFMSLFTNQNIKAWDSAFQPKTVKLSLPRFALKGKYNVKHVLHDMGVKSVFSEADFSRMFTEDRGVSIDDVNHHTFIKVDETGTEAAAASSAEIVESALAPEVTLTANRPFFFVITDEQTTSLLFLGFVANPNE